MSDQVTNISSTNEVKIFLRNYFVSHIEKHKRNVKQRYLSGQKISLFQMGKLLDHINNYAFQFEEFESFGTQGVLYVYQDFCRFKFKTNWRKSDSVFLSETDMKIWILILEDPDSCRHMMQDAIKYCDWIRMGPDEI